MLLGDSFSDTLDSRKDRQKVSGRSDRRHTSVVTARQPWISYMRGQQTQVVIAAFLRRPTHS